MRVAIAVALLILIVRLIDPGVLVSSIAGGDLKLVLVILIGAMADRYLMAYKWNRLLRARGIQFSDAEAFRIYLSSWFVGAFLPTSVGADVYRAWRATVGERKLAAITTSIVVERLIGFLAVLVVALVGLTVLVVAGDTSFYAVYGLIWGLALAAIVGLWLTARPAAFALAKRWLSDFRGSRFVRGYLGLHEGYVDYGRDWKTVSAFFLLTIFEQGILVVLNLLAGRALGLDVPIVYYFANVPVSLLLTRLPISINAIGVLEGSYVFFFAKAGLSPTESVSLALLMRGVGWILLIPSGLVFLYDSLKSRVLRSSPAELGRFEQDELEVVTVSAEAEDESLSVADA